MLGQARLELCISRWWCSSSNDAKINKNVTKIQMTRVRGNIQHSHRRRGEGGEGQSFCETAGGGAQPSPAQPAQPSPAQHANYSEHLSRGVSLTRTDIPSILRQKPDS